MRNLANFIKTMLGCNMLSSISKVNVELCSQCNLNCKYCELERKSKRKKFMDIKIYEKLLKELSNPIYSIDLFALSHSAEVLLHPEFEEFVNLTREYLDNGFRPNKIVMDTNLTLLDHNKADFIIDSGVFDWIVCSIDGRNKDSFEMLRYPANYNQVLYNFNYLVSQNNKKGHKIQMDINNGNNVLTSELQLDSWLAQCFRKADNVYHYDFHNWTGNVDNPHFKTEKHNGFCSFTFDTIVLTSDGMISKCCSDLNGNTIYGDFNKNTLYDIYHSNRRKRDLIKMALFRRHDVKGCDKCNRK